MKRQKGFTLIELMVSMSIVVSVVAIATDALMQAEHVTTMVTYEANTQENLRAGMHFMVRDLMQAGEGQQQYFRTLTSRCPPSRQDPWRGSWPRPSIR
jgi:prepilin-type N-terminal cleavage/methylation domain-containing protein